MPRNTSVQGDLFFGLMPVFVRGIPRAGVNCVLSEAMVDYVRDRLHQSYSTNLSVCYFQNKPLKT